MAKREPVSLKKLDTAFRYMKTRSMVENLSLLPLGNNVVICNKSDSYRVFISSNPEARITKNNFSELPELDSGKWIEYLVLKNKAANYSQNQDLMHEKYISDFVTEKIKGFVNPLYQKYEEEEQKKVNQKHELLAETRDNWKGFIQKITNN